MDIMNNKNKVFKNMITDALLIGMVVAISAFFIVLLAEKSTTRKMMESVFVKTQNMEYTTEDGEQVEVAISSNSDDSKMLMFTRLDGESQRALVDINEDGTYEVKDNTLSEEDAVSIVKIASENGQWREM